MTGVPPQVNEPNRFIIGGVREVVLIFIFLVVGLACLAIPIAWPIRIALVVIAGFAGAGVTWGRVPPSGVRVEVYIANLIKFNSRPRMRQRETGQSTDDPESRPYGASSASQRVPIPSGSIPQDQSLSPSEDRRLSFSLSPGYLASAVSFAFLGMLIAWALLGGVTELLFMLGAH